MVGMDLLEGVTREFVAALRGAGKSNDRLLFEIEDTLRLTGSGGALPMAISEAIERHVVISEPVLDELERFGLEASDAEIIEDVADLRKTAALLTH